MTSPYLTMKPRSMFDVKASAPKRELPKCCPFCGEDPPPAVMAKYGRYIVGCENVECAVEPLVSGATLTEAWAKWNKRS